MSFSLRVVFTGLCAFVENAKAGAQTKMCALLVDGTRAQGMTQVQALDKTILRYHRPFVTFPIYSIQSTASKPKSYGVWYLEKERITIEIKEAKDKENTFKAYRMPEYEHPQRYDKNNEVHRRSLSWLMNLGLAAPNVAEVSQSALKLAGAPTNVVAQVLIDQGNLLPARVTNAVWEFEDYLSFPQCHRRQFCHEVELVFTNLTSASLLSRPFSDAAKYRKLDLTPQDAEKVVEIRISNLCDVNPLSWDTAREHNRDQDVKWYYEILSERAKEEIKDKLNGKYLPTPAPIQFTDVTEGPGSGNCIPLQFPKQEF